MRKRVKINSLLQITLKIFFISLGPVSIERRPTARFNHLTDDRYVCIGGSISAQCCTYEENLFLGRLSNFPKLKI